MTEPRPESGSEGPLRGLRRPLLAVAVLVAALAGAALLAHHAQPHDRTKAAAHPSSARTIGTTWHSSIGGHATHVEAHPSEPAASAQSPSATGLITGTVVDESGSPVEATVFALRARALSAPPLTAQSGKDGRFELKLGLHTWALWAEVPGSRSGPGEIELDDHRATAEVKIVLRASAHVEGMVYDPDGSPSRGALVLSICEEGGVFVSVAAESQGLGGIITSTAIPSTYCARAECNDHGWYEAQVPTGKVLVRAQSNSAASMAESVTLRGGQHAQVDLHLTADKLLTGRVSDAQGHPIAGAEVCELAAPTGEERFTGFPFARTDEDGTYRLTLRFPLGGCNLYVTAEGYLPETGDAGRPPVERLDFVLHRCATLRGFVRLPDGTPVAGARVAQAEPGRDRAKLVASIVPDEHSSAEDGSFEIGNARSGPSVVEAAREGSAVSESAPFDVAEGGTVEGIVVTLCRGAGLHGRVLDAQTRAPLDRAEWADYYQSPGESGAAYHSTDAEGAYRIEHLPPGHHRFRVYLQGYVQQGLELDLAEGQDVEKDILLEKGCTLRVRVDLAEGLEAGQIWLDVWRPGGGGSICAERPTDGVFEVSGLTPGWCEMLLGVRSKPGTDCERRQRVEIGDEPTREVQVRVSRCTVVRGHVRCGGNPLASRYVELVGRGADGGTNFHASTDAAGDIVWLGVGPGEYLVAQCDYLPPIAECPSGSPVVRVPEGVDSLDVEVDLPAK